MKYLGIDYGSKRVGIAISNSEGTLAFPRATLANDARLVHVIVEFAASEKIEKIIIGDTRALGNAENTVTKEAEEFIAALASASTLPIERAFEGWSSIEASRYAPSGKEHDDSAAAALILQRFIDSQTHRL